MHRWYSYHNHLELIRIDSNFFLYNISLNLNMGSEWETRHFLCILGEARSFLNIISPNGVFSLRSKQRLKKILLPISVCFKLKFGIRMWDKTFRLDQWSVFDTWRSSKDIGGMDMMLHSSYWTPQYTQTSIMLISLSAGEISSFPSSQPPPPHSARFCTSENDWKCYFVD